MMELSSGVEGWGYFQKKDNKSFTFLVVLSGINFWRNHEQ